MALVAAPQSEVSVALERKALPWIEKARSLTVTDQASYDKAAEELLAVKSLRREAEEHHRPLIQAAHETHKLALAALAKIDDPLKQAENVYKQSIAAFDLKQKQAREEEERQARLRAQKEEEDRRLREAEEAQSQGATAEEVDAIIEQPLVVPEPIIPKAFERAKGVTTVKTYSAEVINMRELCRAIADGKASETLVAPNMPALNGMARALKTTLAIPGVRLVTSNQVRAGGR